MKTRRWPTAAVALFLTTVLFSIGFAVALGSDLSRASSVAASPPLPALANASVSKAGLAKAPSSERTLPQSQPKAARFESSLGMAGFEVAASAPYTTPTPPPPPDPEYRILNKVKTDHPSWQCQGPYGTPGHRYLLDCSTFFWPTHPADGYVDDYGTAGGAQVAWQNRRNTICPSYPSCTDITIFGYEGYDARNSNFPNGHTEEYMWGSHWMMGAESQDDTDFNRGAPGLMGAIAQAAIDLGYLPYATPTTGPTNTHTSTPSPTTTPSCQSAWQVVPSANQGSDLNELYSISTLPGGDVWAVGNYSNTTTQRMETLTERWTGSAWSIEPSPNGGNTFNILRGVDAYAPNDVWAVGYASGTGPILLTYHWNGTQWNVVSNPNPGGNYANNLFDVVALGPSSMWTAGFWRAYSPQGLLMQCNGQGCTQAANPTPGVPAGMSAIEAVNPTNIWAVGSQAATPVSLIWHYDGTAWSNWLPWDDADVLNDVSAASANDVWAMGDQGILRYNGAVWSMMPNMPNIPPYKAVLARSANDVWVVGSGNFAHYDGTSWTLYPLPSGAIIRSLSAQPGEEVWAAGSTTSGGVARTLTMKYGPVCGTSTPYPTSTPWNTPTATPTGCADPNPPDLVPELSWIPSCDAPILRVTTYSPYPEIYYTTTYMRLTNSIGEHMEWAVPPIQGGQRYSVDCPVGTCMPSSWLGHLPLTLTVDYYNNLCEYSETNNTMTLNYPPPLPTPCITPTNTATGTPPTPITPTQTPVPACEVGFADVPLTHTFYQWVMCLTCHDIVGGYACGGPGEPCNQNNQPYYRPGANVSRGQLSKIVSLAANMHVPPYPTPCPTGTPCPIPTPLPQQFTDVPYGSTFFDYIYPLAEAGIVSGYPCGGVGEPCDPQGRPYFRPNAGASRGQICKIVAQAASFNDDIPSDRQTFEDVAPTSTFWLWIERVYAHAAPPIIGGYPCGGVGEPCGPGNRPYFRPGTLTTRGQLAKIVARSFFPECGQ